MKMYNCVCMCFCFVTFIGWLFHNVLLLFVFNTLVVLHNQRHLGHQSLCSSLLQTLLVAFSQG